MRLSLTQASTDAVAHDSADAEAFDFGAVSDAAAADDRLKAAVQNAVVRNDEGRRARLAELPDADALRTLAGQIKQHTLDHLDHYLEQFAANVRAAGGHVHFASDGAEARQIVRSIATDAGARGIIKSKSMASEEIELTHDLEAAGFDVVETDLGEFVIQIDHDKPSHIVAPIIHKDLKSIAELFSRHFESPYTEDPAALTMQARNHLRGLFRKSDLGMTGGNFLIAETGQVLAVENEGNVRQSMASPRVLVSLVGIEKMLPRIADAAVMLKLLARSATGQPMTVYSSLFGAGDRQRDGDGPEEFHVVLLDNGRSEILGGDYRETLRCIRCGACLYACPIYRSIGGHAYGSVYPGPIGALITPLFRGIDKFKDLFQASSLCGACYDACPVKIDIPKHLINLRRDLVSGGINSRAERIVYRAWASAMKSRFLYGVVSGAQRIDLRRRADKDGWVRKMPSVASGWTNVRDMPQPAKRGFRAMWRDRDRNSDRNGERS